MKQNIYIAALLAGMLALAGCGGGGSTDSGTGNNGNNGNTATASKVDAPAGTTPTTYNVEVGTPQTYTVAAGESITFGGAHKYECAAGADCKVTLENQAGTLVIMSTGMLAYVPPPPISTTTGTTTRPTDSTDPLSEEVLLEALKSTGSKKTVWSNAGIARAATGAEAGQAWVYEPLSGPKIELWISGDDDAYWGHWVKSTKAVGNAPVLGDRGLVWGGATPYGEKPATSLAKANYNTGALFYFRGDGTSWSNGTGALVLEADFARGMVGGKITPTAQAGKIGDTDVVQLTATAIGNDGTFSGSASFENTAITGDSGTWQGGFFGSPTTINAQGKESPVAPTDVAGEFSVSRPKTTVPNMQTKLDIRGVFGHDAD